MSMLILDLDHHYEEVAEALGDDLQKEVPKVLRSALSAAARRVRKRVVEEAASRYAYQEQDTWKATNSGAIKLKAGTKRDKFYTRFTSTGPMNELMDFMVSPATYEPGRRGSVKGKVMAAGALRNLGGNPKPFITKFKSGHIAVVARVPGKSYTKGLSERQGAKLDTTKIESLLSPSVPSMVQNAGLRETAEELMEAELPVQIQKAIKRTLKKAGRA